jgi:muramoyltetrapeptide carboxypeptidase
MTRRLSPGDKVAVITPASPTDDTRLQTGLAVLREWGLEPDVGAHVSTDDTDMTAGTDADRAADLMWALTAPDIAAVLCAEGGYGTLRILDDLDWARLAAAPPRTVMGYSDNTALLLTLWSRLGWGSLHGPHVGELAAMDQDSLRGTRATLMEPIAADTLRGHTTGRDRPPAQGTLLGGNLTMLAAAAPVLGPPQQPYILAVEDVNEAPYRIDRCLVQLHRAGWTGRLAGIAAGEFLNCGDPAPVLAEHAERWNVPLLTGLPFGHGHRQHPLRLGARATIEADTLTVHGPDQ